MLNFISSLQRSCGILYGRTPMSTPELFAGALEAGAVGAWVEVVRLTGVARPGCGRLVLLVSRSVIGAVYRMTSQTHLGSAPALVYSCLYPWVAHLLRLLPCFQLGPNCLLSVSLPVLPPLCVPALLPPLPLSKLAGPFGVRIHTRPLLMLLPRLSLLSLRCLWHLQCLREESATSAAFGFLAD